MADLEPKRAYVGLNTNSLPSQIKDGQLTHALNAVVENFDGKQVAYQNEVAENFCATLPENYQVIGQHFIPERDKLILFMVNTITGQSEIGDIQKCIYTKIVNADCLRFSIDHPILQHSHKVTSKGTEVYWTDDYNPVRFLDIDNIPYQETHPDACTTVVSTDLDCNRIRVQPHFTIPEITYQEVTDAGAIIAGTYQFGFQYANGQGDGYTSYLSITNPIPIAGPPNIVTPNFNYETNKSIKLEISNIDTSGVYDYFNLAVVKTINDISSVELVATYQIDQSTKTVIYSGQGKTDIRLSIDDLLEQFPIYEKAEGLTTVADMLVLSNLEGTERVSYQTIANEITLGWQTWRIPANPGYRKEVNAANLRGYMRDEIYAADIVFLLKGGGQTDHFHIPGRESIPSDWENVLNDDVFDDSSLECDPTENRPKPRWQVYNTGIRTGYESVYTNFIAGISVPECNHCPVDIDLSDPRCYTGPYEYGQMAYWESSETYPCNPAIWGELSGKPIRHHKFPDSLITHIHDNAGNIYPIGFKVDLEQIRQLIISSSLTQEQKDNIVGFKILRSNRRGNKSVIAKGLINNVGKYTKEGVDYYFPNYPFNDLRKDPFIGSTLSGDDESINQTQSRQLDGFGTADSKKRFAFHSPDTHFFQPYLGNILKLETAEHGTSQSHFVEVKKHARYKFLTTGSYGVSLAIGIAAGSLPKMRMFVTGGATAIATFYVPLPQPPDGMTALTVFQLMKDLIEKMIPRKNYVYQFNAVGNYTDFVSVLNDGNKQRKLDLSSYLNPGAFSAGDSITVNNYLRESSVYLRSTNSLLYPHELSGVPEDQSRWVLRDENCSNINDTRTRAISSYYASIKRGIPNQYGEIGSHEVLDTGSQFELQTTPYTDDIRFVSVFGGDIFINRFAFKNKLPFFTDNRVGVDDESDVFYDELGNVGYPLYWMSTDLKTQDSGGVLGFVKQIFGVKVNNFDCRADKAFYQNGRMYLAAIGIPYFYTESEVNVDYRQANNDKEGDFYPRVSTSIPDQWLQPIEVPYEQDNTYVYNKTFSKQHKEGAFSLLPLDFDPAAENRTKYQNRAVYSDAQRDTVTYRKNNWLVFRPVSRFDFPLNYGKLISLEGLENREVLARFENKSLLYNRLLTVDTSSSQAVYLGNDKLFSAAPPLDYAETDTGYMGTQHKFFLKTENGHITIDARRGRIFILSGTKVEELTSDKYGMTKFFAQHLPFYISQAFPDYNTDNHFKGVGLHGVYDVDNNRLLLTKLDYEPIAGVQYDATLDQFTYNDSVIQLGDEHFINRSFTISFDFDTVSWISYHSYTPRYYGLQHSGFLSGEPGTVWEHPTQGIEFNKSRGVTVPYILEYPIYFGKEDQILQSVCDYSTILQYSDPITYVETDDIYFNKAEIRNRQQSSGVLELIPQPQSDMRAYLTYPKYKTSSREILVAKVNGMYCYNDFWDSIKQKNLPVSLQGTFAEGRIINQANIDYSNKSFTKARIQAKDCIIRHTLDNTSGYKLISQFILPESIVSNR